jgi:acetylornithine deacetylase/succinyl-diaminopimelate desuccinylase-like protein
VTDVSDRISRPAGIDLRQAKAITSFIEQHRAELAGFLSELIRLRSVFPPGEYDTIARCMRDALRADGIRAELITAPRIDIEARGLTYPRPNVVAALEGSGPGPVLLIGTHMDVVAAGDEAEWRQDPFGGAVVDGCVWGRGACDAKNSMAAQVFAVRALLAAGVRLRGTLLLIASVDDEGRFDRLKWPGMTYLADRGLQEHGFPMPDMVINGEASGLASICGSFKGRIIIEIPVIGETAHAATPYGVNAIDRAMTLVQALKEIDLKSHPLHGRETLNICAIQGVAASYVDIPPICRVGIEIRVVPPHGTGRLLDEINRTIGRLAAADPHFKVGSFTIFSNRQPIEFSDTSPLVTAIRESAALVGVDARFAGILGTGELQAFVVRGIPGVTYGPGSIERVHKPNEYLEIDELVRQTQIYALTVLELCGERDA